MIVDNIHKTFSFLANAYEQKVWREENLAEGDKFGGNLYEEYFFTTNDTIKTKESHNNCFSSST